MPAGEIQSVFMTVLLAFPQREGTELDLAGDAVVQAAVVHHDIVDDPGRGTATHDKDDVLAGGSPSIPEMIQGTDEVGFGRIHPRQFIDEYYFLPFREACKETLEEAEGIAPGFGLRAFGKAGSIERLSEFTQLFVHGCIQDTGVLEGKLVVEGLANKEGFPYPVPAIQGDEFGLV